MKIHLIELENYRQYRGHTTVELSCEPDKNINIVQGVNGAGKTNMLNAINWCLYGGEEYLGKYVDKKQPIINDAELREAKVGQKVYCKVTLKMVDDKDRDRFYQFERRVGFRRDKNGQYSSEDEEFHAFMQIDHDMKETEHTELLINRILPRDIKSFFFFDGEKLDEFFKEEKSAKVQAAIFDVSQLSLLDRTIEHLDKTISSIRNGIKGGSGRVNELQEAIKALEDGRDSLKIEKKERNDSLAETKSKLKDVENKLMNCNEPLAKELDARRKVLEKNRDRIRENIGEIRSQAIDRIIEVGPSIYCVDALSNAKEQIDRKAKKGDIPPKIQQTFVNDLLERGECICGAAVSKNTEARQRLLDLLNAAKVSEIYEQMVELKYRLEPVMKKVSDFPKKQDDLRRSLILVEADQHKTEEELKELNTKLKGINVAEVANLELQRGILKKEEEQLFRDIGVLEEKIKNANAFIDQQKRELDRELAKEDRFREIQERLSFANSAFNSISAVRQKLIDDVRSTIQKKTKDYFLRLIWKKGTYDDITIDNDYNISVTNKTGSECLYSLSAGERQVLALSFLAALREASGFAAPVIIDTPLGRISKEPRENIAELLPEFLKDAQVTMFVTDEEYTRSVRQILSKKVGKEYALFFDEKESQTEVRPYGK